MTVSEMIEELSKLDPNLKVFSKGYEGGYEDASVISNPRQFTLHVNTAWYYGPHEETEFEKTKGEVVMGVVIA